jgi:hypothetical protein
MAAGVTSSDRRSAAMLVSRSPAVSNGGRIVRSLCFGGSFVDGAPPAQPGGYPEPPQIGDPGVCGAARRKAAAICLHGSRMLIQTPGVAQQVTGSVAGRGGRQSFTAMPVGSSGTTWQALVTVQRVVTSRRHPGELAIGIDYDGGHSSWTAPLRVHERSC